MKSTTALDHLDYDNYSPQELEVLLKNDIDFFDHAQSFFKRLFVTPFLKQILRYMDTIKSEANIINFLDIGCGKGFITNHINQALKCGKNGLGIDMSTSKIAFAKKHYQETNFAVMNEKELNKIGKTFDLVVCTEILEHYVHPEELIITAKKLANRYILISVPHEPYRCIANMMRLKYLSRFGNTPDHKQKYGKKSLLKFLSQQLPGRNIDISAKGFWLLAICKKS